VLGDFFNLTKTSNLIGRL